MDKVESRALRSFKETTLSHWVLSEPYITWMKMFPERQREMTKEHKHIKKALSTCGDPDWAYAKSTEGFRNNIPLTQEKERNKHHNVVIIYVTGCQKNLENFL